MKLPVPRTQDMASPHELRLAVTVAQPGLTARNRAVNVPHPAPGTHRPGGSGADRGAPSATSTLDMGVRKRQ